LLEEVISATQTSLKFLDNVNVHNIISLMKTLLIQMNLMNSWIKNLVRNGDFKDAVPMLFGGSFGTLAKKRLEAAADSRYGHTLFGLLHEPNKLGWQLVAIASKVDGNPATDKLPRNNNQRNDF